MAIITKLWTIQEALDRGMEFYEIQITDWGDLGVNADPITENGVSQTPLSQFPIQGIAIAPDSIVDRCQVLYNPTQTFIVPAFAPNPNSTVLSKDQPYIGRLPAPLFVQAFNDDLFDDTIIRASGVVGAFGTVLPTSRFSVPFIKLRLLLLGNGISPGSRARAQICDLFSTFTGPGTEDLIHILPSHGRKRARVTVANTTAASTVAVRVGVVRSCKEINQLPPPATFDRSIETTVVAPTAVVGPGTASFVIDPLVGEYVSLYGERTAGGAAALTWNIEVED